MRFFPELSVRTSTLALCFAPLLLAGCVSPRVVNFYDPDCQIVARKVELTLEKTEALDACSNHECAAQIVGAAVSVAASAVVSGSIAVVGNVVFWMEKTAKCRPAKDMPKV